MRGDASQFSKSDGKMVAENKKSRFKMLTNSFSGRFEPFLPLNCSVLKSGLKSGPKKVPPTNFPELGTLFAESALVISSSEIESQVVEDFDSKIDKIVK